MLARARRLGRMEAVTALKELRAEPCSVIVGIATTARTRATRAPRSAATLWVRDLSSVEVGAVWAGVCVKTPVPYRRVCADRVPINFGLPVNFVALLPLWDILRTWELVQ